MNGRIMRTLNGVQLLILNDWGLDPLDARLAARLYEILRTLWPPLDHPDRPGLGGDR
jgi:hypothetical protein